VPDLRSLEASYPQLFRSPQQIRSASCRDARGAATVLAWADIGVGGRTVHAMEFASRGADGLRRNAKVLGVFIGRKRLLRIAQCAR
jgi:hypothetical protein